MAKPKTPPSELSHDLDVVGTKDKEAPHGMTANSITQVSLDPEMVTVAIEMDSPTRVPIPVECGAREADRQQPEWEVRAW